MDANKIYKHIYRYLCIHFVYYTHLKNLMKWLVKIETLKGIQIIIHKIDNFVGESSASINLKYKFSEKYNVFLAYIILYDAQ